MTQKLIIFDIDGTLTKPSIAHGYAFIELFKRKFHKKLDLETLKSYNGFTDVQIIKDLLAKFNIQDYNLDELKALLADLFKAEFLEHNDIEIYKGVKELLLGLGEHKLALATGNLEEIAKAKLQKIGIWNYFCCGGFSNYSILREELISIAMDKANFSDKDLVFYVGDTPRDIEAAHINGIKAIAVKNTYGMLHLDKADLIINNYDEIIDIVNKQ